MVFLSLNYKTDFLDRNCPLEAKPWSIYGFFLAFWDCFHGEFWAALLYCIFTKSYKHRILVFNNSNYKPDFAQKQIVWDFLYTKNHLAAKKGVNMKKKKNKRKNANSVEVFIMKCWGNFCLCNLWQLSGWILGNCGLLYIVLCLFFTIFSSSLNPCISRG